ncbi:MAG: hypothetical protein AVDCRST_MAG55-2239 [uncultured Rubrobacteraceae bacterium]|uniref:Uncharacterized protein n=1 Tax=uncultured Rubrobacteraceae bacterium TaxID=349277 RepID=A0A6J4PV19_9ACTN|nr:MAG: hypothetical protein AVDCRST_MAG55-2239 [uncultured Rubrobacteraceae bacterium]
MILPPTTRTIVMPPVRVRTLVGGIPGSSPVCVAPEKLQRAGTFSASQMRPSMVVQWGKAVRVLATALLHAPRGVRRPATRG